MNPKKLVLGQNCDLVARWHSKSFFLWAIGCLGLLSITGQAGAANSLADQARALETKVVAWRRDIHQHPELSNRETRTAELVAKHLKKLGIKVRTQVAHTGVVGVLEGGKPGGVVALRADMDALPVVERTGLPYASTVVSKYEGQEVGVMHACGHDNHVAILMGAAELLAANKDELRGTVVFIFQPAEEGPPLEEEGGAKMMVQEGVLESPQVDAIFGLHVGQQDTVGQASYRALGAMASAQRFDVVVKGRQTHGAMPWAGVDPIVVASQLVLGLQTIVSRRVDITKAPAVVSVGSIHGGVRNNIIPDEVKLSGTIRTFDPEVRAQIHQHINSVAQGVAESFGATIEVVIDPGVPVTFNDQDLTRAMVPSLEKVYGEEGVRVSSLITGAEDFAFFQEKVPGFFFFIGVRPKEVPAQDAIPNHSPLFYADEGALVHGVEAMSRLAIDFLDHGGSAQ